MRFLSKKGLCGYLHKIDSNHKWSDKNKSHREFIASFFDLKNSTLVEILFVLRFSIAHVCFAGATKPLIDDGSTIYSDF